MALNAVVTPKVEQVVWYINGEPYAVAPYPYTARGAPKPGEHTIQVRLPYSEEWSASIRISVR